MLLVLPLISCCEISAVPLSQDVWRGKRSSPRHDAAEGQRHIPCRLLSKVVKGSKPHNVWIALQVAYGVLTYFARIV
jgi:hypothetical protein